MPERLDWIDIALSKRTIRLRWSTRDALLEELALLDLRELRNEFEKVGTSRPVKLTLERKSRLYEAIDEWAEATQGGFDALPDEIFDLRNELEQDVHDAGQRDVY